MHRHFQVHNVPTTSLQSVGTGTIVTGHSDGKMKLLRLFEPNDEHICEIVSSWSFFSRPITSISAPETSAILVSCGNSIAQYDIPKEKMRRRIVAGEQWLVHNVCDYLTSDLACSVTNNNTLNVYDLRTRQQRPIQEFKNSEGALVSMCVNRDKVWEIHCGSETGLLMKYDLRNSSLVKNTFFRDHGNKEPITGLAVGGDNLVVSQLLQNPVLVSHASDIDESLALQYIPKSVVDKKYMVDMKFEHGNFVSGSETGEVYVWDSDGISLAVHKTFNSYMTMESESNKLLKCVGINGGKVLGSGGDGKLHVWK